MNEGEAAKMNLWIFGVDYVDQALTVFILLYVVRKTAFSLLA